MNTLFKIINLTFLLFTSTHTFSTEQEIYLTRHAEKQDDNADPSLNTEGKQRALNLANFLKSKNIKSIYSTKYNRTIQTAKPLADLLGLQINYYNPLTLAEFAQQIKNQTGNILIVGHSNTTPEMVSLLGGDQGAEMPETEYDRSYRLVIKDDKILTQVIKKIVK